MIDTSLLCISNTVSRCPLGVLIDSSFYIASLIIGGGFFYAFEIAIPI